MQCSCGGETIRKQHTVTSRSGIVNWLGREHHNPVVVDRDVCGACGRQLVMMFDSVTG